MSHKFPYKWNLADGYPAKAIEAHGLKVFGTFICYIAETNWIF